MGDSLNADTLDMSLTYRAESLPGVAVRVVDYGRTEEYEGDLLVCVDEECSHDLSEMCWAEGDTSLVVDFDHAVVVMVGDDRRHTVDVSELTPIPENGFCPECGQIGCGHGR